MSAHTPGPWVVAHELRPTDEMVADLENGTYVVVEGRTGLGNFMADARLIAAAPDLLAALQAIVDQEQHDGQPETHMHDMADIARAAIAKAEGR